MIDTSKIIHGVVGGGRYTVTSPIVKEDYGLYLKIEGLELPSTYEVDFSNSEHNGTSVTMIGNADGVLIPNQFISSGKDVFAFLYHVGDNYGRTVFKFRIPNKLRPDRTDEQPTPEQQSVIDQAINALNEAVEQTAQDVVDADASAQSASESAEQAQESARTAGLYSDTAQTYANSAEISANSASASATASAQSAEQSAINSADAQDSAEEAQGYASASAQSATASANSASQASASATSASQSASSAQGYASQAQTSAQTASSKATEASTSASTASTKASEASASALSASGYATQAEQAKTSAQTAQGLAESARDDAISAQESAEDARDEAQSIVDGISAKAEQIDQNTADIASLEEDIFKPYATDMITGRITAFEDGADDIPLKSLTVTLEPIQDTSQGEPSPENICPITGHTGFNLYKTGGNLITKEFPEDAFYGQWNTGDTTISTASIIKVYCVYVGKNTRLHFVKDVTTTLGWGVAFTDEYVTSRDGVIIYDALVMNNRANYLFNSGEHPYMLIYTTISSMGGTGFESRNARLYFYQDALRPFSPRGTIDKYPYDWTEEAGVVYGCTIDILTGVLTITHQIKTFDGSENWQITNDRFYVNRSLDDFVVNDADLISNMYPFGGYKTNSANMSSDKMFYTNSGTGSLGNRIFVADSSFADVASFQSFLATHPLTVYGLLATPIEVQLEPNELASILGGNQIWTDNGTIDVEYRADTKLYIERLTAPDSDDMIADANITSGQYFMVGNSLFKATANIANGGQIVVGTNCTRVSLAQALNEINA